MMGASVLRRKPLQRFASLAILLVIATGCQNELITKYGPSKGYTAARSVNGFSALRDAYQRNGFKHRDVKRLTSRIRRSSVIVWTPTHATGIETGTTTWMDRWLRTGNRTLVYVLPDSGSESSYYRELRPEATPEQRLEYRRKYAECLVKEHQWHLNRVAWPSNGWFAANPKVQTARLVASKDADAGWRSVSLSDAEARDTLRLEWVLEEFDETKVAQTATVPWQPTGPGSSPWSGPVTTTRTKTKLDFKPLMQTDSGEIVVAKVTSPYWKHSQILVVAGGSLLSNYALTHSTNQRLANQIINESIGPLVENNVIDEELHLAADGSAPQVAFATAEGVFPISERVDDIPRATGAELLTIYPLSLVTIHIAIVGIVICLMLLPIFGRPRKVPANALTHFGDHLDAVATLMRRRGGEQYARRRISDYMKRIRGESAGPWVLDEPKPKPIDKPVLASAPTAGDNPSNDSTLPTEADR